MDDQQFEYWEHDFAYAVNGNVLELVSSCRGAKMAVPLGWTLPMTIEEYISRMGESGDGYQFAGSYPYRDGSMIVMKRRRIEV